MSFDPAAAAQALGEARLAHARIDLSPSIRPCSAQEAYAVQDQIGRLLGKTPRAWKVGAPDAQTEPSAAPIYDVNKGASRLSGSIPNLIGVEAEIAAVFGTPLPARETAYADGEVASAVHEVCVAIEVCASRLHDWQSADDLAKLADHGLNYALVLGDGRRDFAHIDFPTMRVRTCINGRVIKDGKGTHAVGNPLMLLTWLANHARSRGGIAAGTAVTTGAWLGLHPIRPGDAVRVEFPEIGSASVAFPTD